MRNYIAAIYFIMYLAIAMVSPTVSHAQILNGDFTAGGANWTVNSIVITAGTAPGGPTESVAFGTGALVATSNNVGNVTTGDDRQIFAQQTFTATEVGFLSYVLTYTDIDIGDFDFPVAAVDGTFFRIGLDGSLVGGLPAVNNGANVAGLNGFTTLTAGAHTVAFGVRTRDSGFGAGVATWDDIDFQEITQSPAAQTVLENNPLTLSGVDAVQVADNGPADADAFEVTLSVSNGTLTLGVLTGITITGGANGTATLTFTGTDDDVNAALDSLVYNPNTAFSGSDTLVFTSTANTITDTDNIAITVTPGTSTLTVTKTALPAVNVPAGTTVTYTYVVTNTGDQVLTNISLSDSHNGSGPAPIPANEVLTNDGGAPGGSSDGPNDGVWDILAPGDEVTFTATYVVTQNDIDTLQ